ncbi:uncharacterized protein LOC135829405 isoform X2 [Sycon ciliatum]
MRLSDAQRTPAACAAACASLGFHHAGIRNDWECWCGEDTRYTAEAQCNKCQGDDKLLCGGLGVMALYDLDHEWPSFRYNGCFRYETAQDISNLLPHTQWTTSEAAHWSHQLRQPAVCVKWCLEKGFRFAGWTHVYECHCGLFVPDVTEATCDPCFADRRYLCGTRTQIAIYEVVQDPPRAQICGGENHTAVAGYPIGLHCTADGDSPVVVAWHRMRGNDKKAPLGDATHILAVTGDLTIHNAKKSDEGLYVCEASNENMLSKLQRSHTQTARLTVQLPPTAHLSLDNNGKTLLYGETAVLRCQVKGDAPLIVQWFFKGKRLDPSSSAKHIVRNQIGSAVVSLEVFNVSSLDLGEYACEATNPKIILPQARVRRHSMELTALDNTVIIPKYMQPPSDMTVSDSQDVVVKQAGVGLSVGVIVLVVVQVSLILLILTVAIFYRYRKYRDEKDLYNVNADVKVNPVATNKSNISPPISQHEQQYLDQAYNSTPQQGYPLHNNQLAQTNQEQQLAAAAMPGTPSQVHPHDQHGALADGSRVNLPPEPRRAVVYMDDMEESICETPRPPPPPPTSLPPSTSHYPNQARPRNGGTLPRVNSTNTSRWSLNSWGGSNTLPGHGNGGNAHGNGHGNYPADFYALPPDGTASRNSVSKL